MTTVTRSIRARVHEEDGRLRINKSLWFVVIFVALLLMVLIDGGSIVYARVQLEQEAIDAGSEAANEPAGNAYNAAVGQLTDENTIILKDDFSINPKTGAVTLTVQKEATTIFVRLIDPIKDWATVSVTKTVAPNTT